jgi:hypothetical protein
MEASTRCDNGHDSAFIQRQLEDSSNQPAQDNASQFELQNLYKSFIALSSTDIDGSNQLEIIFLSAVTFYIGQHNPHLRNHGLGGALQIRFIILEIKFFKRVQHGGFKLRLQYNGSHGIPG